MIKSHKLVQKNHKNVKLCDKKSQNSEKIHKAVNLCGKKSQTSAKKSQKFLCDKTSPNRETKFTKFWIYVIKSHKLVLKS